jgi:hypothetical protein
MRKLVAMTTEARKAQETTPAVGIARDLDIVAERLFKGKYVKGALGNGVVVSGKVASVMNAGFRGIVVHVIIKGGQRREVSMSTCRVWAER